MMIYIVKQYFYPTLDKYWVLTNTPSARPCLDRGPKMETLPHPRDFMGPKWQDRVWSGDIKSGVCKKKCSALRFYATLSAKRSHIYLV